MYEETIETARLTLERCTGENVDLRRLYEVFDADRDGVEDELEYLPWEPHETLYDTKQWVDEQDRRWRQCEGATYVMRANETMRVDPGTLVGVTTFETYWERKAGEQIIFLRRPFYGEGLFAESCYELLDAAFEEMGLELMIADAVEGNERARSIFQKGVNAFGGQYDGILRNRLPTDDGVKDVHRYTVTREQYREAMGRTDGESDEASAADADEASAADADEASAADADDASADGADDAGSADDGEQDERRERAPVAGSD